MVLRLIARLGLASATVATAVTLTIGADRGLGYFLPLEAVTDNLVFSPNSYHAFDMLEMEFEIKANNLGFRGPPINPAIRPSVRLIGCGDSFMLGWGVDYEQTWLRVLEREVRSQGHDIECLNLGKIGTGAAAILDQLHRVLPLLEPDIVLIGLPQRAHIEQPPPMPVSHRTRDAIKHYRFRWYPNIMSRFPRDNPMKLALRDRILVRQQTRLDSISDDQRERLASIDQRLATALAEGNLPPGLLKLLVEQDVGNPIVPTEQLNPSSSKLEREVLALVGELRPIKAMCDRFGARLAVVVYPTTKFSSSEVNKIYEQLGFTYSPDQLATDVPDEIALQACDRLDVPCVTVSNAFRSRESGAQLFYPLDGHLTPEGNDILGRLLLTSALGWIESRQ